MIFPTHLLEGYPIIERISRDQLDELIVELGEGSIRDLIADLMDRRPGAAFTRVDVDSYQLRDAAFEGEVRVFGTPRAWLSLRAPRLARLRELERMPEKLGLAVRQCTGSTAFGLATAAAAIVVVHSLGGYLAPGERVGGTHATKARLP